MDRRPSSEADADLQQVAKRRKVQVDTLERPSLVLALRKCHGDLEALIQQPNPQLDAVIDAMDDANKIVEVLVDEKIVLEHRLDSMPKGEEDLSACHRTLATTELLERILLQLEKPSESNKYPLEPVTQLFVLKRVSQRFRDTIKGSVLLKDKMTRPAIEGMKDFGAEYDILNLVDLAGPKISQAFHRETSGQPWRKIHILPSEDADFVTVFTHSDGGNMVEDGIDGDTNYAGLLAIYHELLEEADESECLDEATAAERRWEYEQSDRIRARMLAEC